MTVHSMCVYTHWMSLVLENEKGNFFFKWKLKGNFSRVKLSAMIRMGCFRSLHQMKGTCYLRKGKGAKITTINLKMDNYNSGKLKGAKL